MLSESTLNKIQLLYKQYLNDISLFTEEDLKLLMNYFSEHSLFKDILKAKGFTVFKKILTNIRLKYLERHDSIVKFDSNKNLFNILLFGNIKKRNLFKVLPKEEKLKKNSGKYLYCVYHCLSNCLFAEMDRHVYMKYLVSNAIDLYEKFVEKIRKYSFFDNLNDYHYNNLFFNYQEKKYGPLDTIYEEGDKIDGIYLIIKGKCLIMKKKINNFSLNNNNSLFYQNNFLTITDNDIYDKKKQENNSKSFHPIFAKDNKNKNVLLTMGPGDIFGDLEINLNNNKRQFSVKCGNYNKIKVWYFPLKIINNVINNFMDLSLQKYDIIKTRFEYVNLVNKVKNDNIINKKEIKIDEIIMDYKSQKSNFKSFNQKINTYALVSRSNNVPLEKPFINRNLLNNMPLISSRNYLLKRKSRLINKNNLSTQSKTKLRILSYKYSKDRNLISIAKENNYIKKANSNRTATKSIDTPRINKMNYLNSLDQKLFMKKMKKNNKNTLIQCSNNETF